jgi:HK97 family phage portal protein
MLAGGNDPSASDPFIWWMGLDSGAGTHLIGPNGPWTVEGKGGIPAITRATALITDPIAQVPWVVQTEADQKALMARAPRWVRDPMLVRPDLRSGQQIWPHAVRRPRAAFWADVIRSALWWGEGSVIFAENEDGSPQPGSMYLLHRWGYSRQKRPGQPASMTVADTYEVDEDGRYQVGPITWRVATLRNPHSPIDETGRSYGVFEMHPATFGLIGRMQEYELGTFRTGIPAGYLKTTTPGMTQAQANELKSKWLAAHGGDRRSIAVLNSTTEFQALAMSPVDTALTEMRKVSLIDIANAFNLDANMIGGPSGDSATYANVESRYSHYRVHTLGRWQTDVEETFGALLPTGRGLLIRLSRLLRADATTRYDQYGKALASGWMTVDEVRDMEGLPPLTGDEEDDDAETA